MSARCVPVFGPAPGPGNGTFLVLGWTGPVLANGLDRGRAAVGGSRFRHALPRRGRVVELAVPAQALGWAFPDLLCLVGPGAGAAVGAGISAVRFDAGLDG